MKQLLTLFFILVCFITLATSDEQKDFVKQLSSIKSLSADFKQVNILKDYGEDIYIGKVFINMKDKALWDYIEPYSSWYLINSESIEHYDEIYGIIKKMWNLY